MENKLLVEPKNILLYHLAVKMVLNVKLAGHDLRFIGLDTSTPQLDTTSTHTIFEILLTIC